MPRKYKYKYKKRSARKTSFSKKRRMTRMKSTRVMYVTRESNRDTSNLCHQVVAGTATGVLTPSSATFQFNDIVNFAECQNLFDNYKITKCAYRWVLVRDSDYTTANPGAYVRIWKCHDYNSQTTLTRQGIMQYANAKEITMKGDQDKTRWFYIKPAVLQLFYKSSVASATGPVWNKWIDTTQNDVPHYALHYAVDNLYTGGTLRLEVKISLAFNGVS